MSHASSKKSLLFVQFCAARGFCKRVLNSRICQHCDVKTSTVTPTFCYFFFIIFLTCQISLPSFIYNICQVLLLGNHLKGAKLDSKIGLYFTHRNGPICRAKTDLSDLEYRYFQRETTAGNRKHCDNIETSPSHVETSSKNRLHSVQI